MGAGLGLVISDKLARLMRRNETQGLNLESGVLNGTKFTF